MKQINFLFGLLIVFLVLSGCEQKPSVEWEPYSEQRLLEAAEDGKSVILYFYASWCGPCHQLRRHTFSDPRVMEALEPFVRLKADMSFQHSKKVRAISQKFRIRALPTILFFNEQGEQVQLKYEGFVSAERLLGIRYR